MTQSKFFWMQTITRRLRVYKQFVLYKQTRSAIKIVSKLFLDFQNTAITCSWSSFLICPINSFAEIYLVAALPLPRGRRPGGYFFVDCWGARKGIWSISYQILEYGMDVKLFQPSKLLHIEDIVEPCRSNLCIFHLMFETLVVRLLYFIIRLWHKKTSKTTKQKASQNPIRFRLYLDYLTTRTMKL